MIGGQLRSSQYFYRKVVLKIQDYTGIFCKILEFTIKYRYFSYNYQS
eukprot:UN20519